MCSRIPEGRRGTDDLKKKKPDTKEVIEKPANLPDLGGHLEPEPEEEVLGDFKMQLNEGSLEISTHITPLSSPHFDL